MVWLKWVMRWLLAVLFVGAGVNHFRDPFFYVSIMPPYLPWHVELVYLSGVCEIVLGMAVLDPWCSRAAAWGLIALLVAVFPANVHVAMHAEHYPQFSPASLYVRLVLQAVLVLWAYWFTRGERRREKTV